VPRGRFLHRRSEHAYTDRLDKAMHNEPEVVSEDVQAGLTADAHLRQREEILTKVREERAQIEAALKRLESQPWGGRFRNHIAHVRRELERMQRLA